jgi:hypothetical protein
LNDVGKVYKETNDSDLKWSILSQLDDIDVPQEKKDEITGNDHSVSLAAAANKSSSPTPEPSSSSFNKSSR